MSVGDGIFWSTIIIVVFIGIILISKAHKWGTFLKVLGVLIILSLLALASFWLYTKYENRPQVVSSLNGVSLGMSEIEVTLAKGKPNEFSESNESKKLTKGLKYNGYTDSYTLVLLDGPTKNSYVVNTICDNRGYGKVLGLGNYSSEKDIYEKLGKPSYISIYKDGTLKLITYPEWNVAFEISKGQVDEVCVTSRSEFRYNEEYSPK